MSTKPPEVYPTHLPSHLARNLVEQHARDELREATLYHSPGFTTYEYSASLKEDGTVELWVTYSSDDGFMLSSGACLRKAVRPFTDERLLLFREQRMFEIARDEYYRRVEEKDLENIRKVQQELFGKPGRLPAKTTTKATPVATER